MKAYRREKKEMREKEKVIRKITPEE